MIESSGRYLIPGLWDMHVHLALQNWQPFVAGVYLPLFIANGVTGVREAIEQKRWREADEQIARVGKVLEGEAALIDSAAAQVEGWSGASPAKTAGQ